ncbi:hypothetical protein C8K38_12390 [Rhodococcus sp. OK611]|uniref:hypothetical protein n=1 Tax=unclassified Rhodococcus (in: high G+C Gram-positive bacteria) TaxID=192944 RepID=UPI000BCF4627|nr:MULTISPECIES: hypothetical protein [unclassified Rhodococcus (in: high G+C Gram-positive bacteria)]PTR36697.1 hypothetical protein C8K38_12390 [Rhodococcus sp. OK611]SNX93791.1 hypothetical protein SAMN05447004_12390 [Rhodococcus sp. OK270]
MSLYVDNDALDGIVSMLAASSSAIDSAGESAPSAIDAGDASAALFGIMARLAENAGQLVVALAAASEAVGEANARYREQDVATADSLDTAWTG